jgi:hypothetical protein
MSGWKRASYLPCLAMHPIVKTEKTTCNSVCRIVGDAFEKKVKVLKYSFTRAWDISGDNVPRK